MLAAMEIEIHHSFIHVEKQAGIRGIFNGYEH